MVAINGEEIDAIMLKAGLIPYFLRRATQPTAFGGVLFP
jgi:hypothetical protein